VSSLQRDAFEIRDELPLGVSVLEASAGTGKTHTIATLAARYVANGLPLDHLLLVSFTHAATGELRDRVRERLTDVHGALARAAAGEPVPPDDELVALLADSSDEDLQRRVTHLARAVADFDGATITTTHGFCQEVLRSLGVAGDVDRRYRLLDDPGRVVHEVLADVYLRERIADAGVSFDEAREIARLAVRNPMAPIAEPRIAHDAVAARLQLAREVRAEFDCRKRRSAQLTFDDLLMRLQAALEGEGGAAIADRLRSRYRVALIDEFQDTDPIQWAIVQRAFGGGDGTLVLIGDPKQAVYSFRGADVYAYLAARENATRRTLVANWRSGEGLVAAYDALFHDATLGHPGIRYEPVEAAPSGRATRLGGLPTTAPLRIRVLRRDLASVALTPSGEFAESRSARANVLADLAAQVVAMLATPAQIERAGPDGAAADARPVGPDDLAVLVRTRYEAHDVRAALQAAGVPAVITATGSVFETESARHWLRLLEALERPGDPARARAAAATPFLDWSPARVAGAPAAEWEELHRQLARWADAFAVGGVAALAEATVASRELSARLLGRDGGERALTDLRHVAELLNAAAADGRSGVAPLVSWLRRQVDAAAGAAAEPDAADRDRGARDQRRLESDAPAVRVLTIHSSKGLEFPVVFCPFLWTARRHDRSPALPVVFHDGAADDRRTLDVSLLGGDYQRHRQQAWDEERGEDLRLAYVALTRACCQAVVWWIGAWAASTSPLGRLVFSRAPDDSVKATGAPVPTDERALEVFGDIADRAPGRVAVETPGDEDLTAVRWTPPPRAPAELDVAQLARTLDDAWRRTSYSGIVAGQYEQRVASEVEEAPGADDASHAGGADGAATETDGDVLAAVPALLQELPATTRVGTLVHRVLETTDFAAEDLAGELRRGIDERLARRHVDVGPADALAAGLQAAIETPLGPLAGDLRLRDLAPADRLDELTFELPLVGGDTPSGQVTLDAVAAAIEQELPAGDPLAGYAARLADPSLRQVLRGYLTGSIDVVARIRAGAERPRFAVIDYKTNWLAGEGERLTAWHHRPVALAAEMVRSHYALQALLYSVALHRYLRWRLRDYDPEHDVAGVLYLFLRGMTGPATPVVDGTPCGVFAWRPPTALMTRLSDLLETGDPA
jgi:exodeoxyribonuclease V beta subunit